jgi:hypothetical protein
MDDSSICDNSKYFEEVKQRWQFILANPYNKKKQYNVSYNENNYDNDITKKNMDAFKDLLQFLTKRGQDCDLFTDSVDERGNGYRYFITVRRPMINGKVQNCTIDDFAIKDQTWNPILDKYLALVFEEQSSSSSNNIGVGKGSVIWKSATLSYLNGLHQVTEKGLGLFDAIDAERKCLKTSDRLLKSFGFSKNSTSTSEGTVGGRKTRRQKKSKRSRKSKRRRHRKTMK